MLSNIIMYPKAVHLKAKYFSAIILLIFLVLSFNAGAVERSNKEGESIMKEKAEITLDDISWLAGRWQGEAFGGICEEAWEKPSGPGMVGTFKLIAEDKIKFYEIMTITPDSSGPVLKLKHFNADLTGWEEKDEVITFSFIEAGENKIKFDGISYELISTDELKITVDMKQADGNISQVVIDCRRIDR